MGWDSCDAIMKQLRVRLDGHISDKILRVDALSLKINCVLLDETLGAK